MTETIIQPTTTEWVIPEDTLERFRERAVTHDRDNTFFADDLADLSELGYLRATLPVERGGLGLTGPGRATFELLPSIAGRDEALRAPGHLRNIIVTEMLEDALQRRHDRRKGAEILDELGPRRFGLGIVDGVARLVFHRNRALRAGLVGEDPHLTGRESALQIVDHIFPGREVDLEVRAVVGAERA